MPLFTSHTQQSMFRISLESLAIDMEAFSAQAMNRIDELLAQGFTVDEIVKSLEDEQKGGTGLFKALQGDIERQVDIGLNRQFQLSSNEPLATEEKLVKRVLDPAAEHCDTCVYLAGLPPMSIDVIEYPSMQLTHGETNCGPYCFTEHNLVDVRGIEKAFRSEYVGHLHTITTSGGRTITGTPNHPILTPRGFVALQFLKDGDEVLCCKLGDGMVFGDPDIDYIPTNIKKIFDSLALIGKRQRRMGRIPDFYGDGLTDGEVEIISTDGELRNEEDAELLQHGNESLFINSLSDERVLSADSLQMQRIGSESTTAHSDVCGSRDSLLLDEGKLTHSDKCGLVATTFVNSIHSQDTINDRTRTFKPSGDDLNRLSVLETFYNLRVRDWMAGMSKLSSMVFAERVISNVKSRTELIHVYTFQNVHGIYNVGGIIASNCKCTIEIAEEVAV